MGIAAFLFACLRPDRVRLGLLAATWMVGAIGAVHAIGILIDGMPNWIVLASTGMELAGAGLAALALRSVPDTRGS